MANMNKDRIQFEIPEEMKRRLSNKLKWGQIKLVYVEMTLDLIKLLEKHDPNMVVAAILSKEMTLKDYVGKKEEEEKDGHKRPETKHK